MRDFSARVSRAVKDLNIGIFKENRRKRVKKVEKTPQSFGFLRKTGKKGEKSVKNRGPGPQKVGATDSRGFLVTFFRERVQKVSKSGQKSEKK